MKEKIIKALILIVPVIFLIALVFYGKKQHKDFVSSIKKNSEMGTATVTSIIKGPKIVTQVKYFFISNKGQQISSEAYTCSSSNDDYYFLMASKIINKNFPVIYNKEEPHKFNQILIGKGDFESFGLIYPKWHDSLFRQPYF